MLVWTLPQARRFFNIFVLLDDTKQLVTWSNICPAKDPLFLNCMLHPALSDGNTTVPVEKPVVMTIQDYYNELVHPPTFSPDELLGMTILHNVDDKLVCAKVVQKIMDRDAENHSQIKFLLALSDGQLEEIISYNELSDLVTESLTAKESGQQDVIPFSGIKDHSRVRI